MNSRQTVLCVFPTGTIQYGFNGPGASNHLTVQFRDGRVRAYADADARELFDRLRLNDEEPPANVVHVETGYGITEYDTLYCAMRMLGYRPKVPHRSRTYKTGILVDKRVPEKGWYLWHRFGFCDGRLKEGLSALLSAVYGVRPEITVV